MELNRRQFIKASATGVTGAVAAAALIFPGQALASSDPNRDSRGVLFDQTLCTGCRACEVACKQWNKLPRSTVPDRGTDQSKPPELNSNTYTRILTTEVSPGRFAFTKRQCMHCQEPGCATACPVGALRKRKDGPVIYLQNKCIGCRYCMYACPFGIPTYQWEKTSPWVRKCTFCSDRLDRGLEPACSWTCPPKALLFGTRQELLAEAKNRIAARPQLYYPHVYGEEEVGGTSWLYIASAPLEDLGLPQLSNEPVTRNAHKAMVSLPYYVAGVTLLMTSIYFIARRKQKIAAGEREKKKAET
jgi:formate dehydrogenase iron-sulfur subunit